MALSIIQSPLTVSLSQSPMIYTVSESLNTLTNTPGFQYVGDVYYWSGSASTGSFSGGSKYTIAKYPNQAGVGIFDLNRIINSTFTEQASLLFSQPKAVGIDFYTQYLSGSTYVTGSHITSSITFAYDGYLEYRRNNSLVEPYQTPHWPIMTPGPATQSFIENPVSSSFAGHFSVFAEPGLQYLEYSGSNGTNNRLFPTTATVVGALTKSFPNVPNSTFPFNFPLTGSLDWYTIKAVVSGSVVGQQPIRFEKVCQQKYPNVRIQWKNQYGQPDFFNFYMVNRQSFQTQRKTYSPQLGNWENRIFNVSPENSATLNYIIDATQKIQVNTDWVSESYNDIFKQLMVSDEIFFYDFGNKEYVDAQSGYPVAVPITMTTSNLQFKTGVVDKLIQYTFEFDLGNPYKYIV